MAAFGSLFARTPVSAAAARTLRFAFSEGGAPNSYSVDGLCAGLLPDLLHSVFEFARDYDAECYPFPWARAQIMVRQNLMDGLCTYPSTERKEYLDFSPEPLFVRDFGYLVYNKKKPGIEILTEVRSYDELRPFEFLGLVGVGWEIDNIPPYIDRQLAIDIGTAFNLMFRRQSGDFLVLTIEQAVWVAQKLGIDRDDLGFVRAEFISNHHVPYHIGLRKDLPDSVAIIDQITDAVRSTEYKNRRAEILASYRL